MSESQDANPEHLAPAPKGVEVEAERLRSQARHRLLTNHPVIALDTLTSKLATRHGHGHEGSDTRHAVGRLVTVTLEDGTVAVPRFQLDTHLMPRPDVARHTERMAASGMGGWQIWDWWTGHNGWLDAVPLTVLDNGDDRRIEDALDRLLTPTE